MEIIAQQMDATKTFDDRVQRIAVLVSTADLLWPYHQEKARAAFTEAFDLGEQEFKERGDVIVREGKGLIAQKPDQRYTVITGPTPMHPWTTCYSYPVIPLEETAT